MSTDSKIQDGSAKDDFRMRLRFRVAKSFTSGELEKSISVEGKTVTLISSVKDEPLNNAKWLIAGANGFVSLEAAYAFGIRLKISILFASLSRRIGVDCGRNVPTSGWSQQVKADLFEKTGMNLRDDIHGIDVFRNDSTACYYNFFGQGKVTASLDPFLDNIARVFPWARKVNAKVEGLLVLLNGVLMNQEPVAQIVLALSAIEGLGQDLSFSSAQKTLLENLAMIALDSTAVNSEEAAEIANVVRNIHKLSLRQGVLRLLREAGLDLKSEWDQIYKERSRLVHGLAPQPGVDYSDLAHRTVSLVVRIIHRLIEIEIGEEELSHVSLLNYR